MGRQGNDFHKMAFLPTTSALYSQSVLIGTALAVHRYSAKRPLPWSLSFGLPFTTTRSSSLAIEETAVTSTKQTILGK